MATAGERIAQLERINDDLMKMMHKLVAITEKAVETEATAVEIINRMLNTNGREASGASSVEPATAART